MRRFRAFFARHYLLLLILLTLLFIFTRSMKGQAASGEESDRVREFFARFLPEDVPLFAFFLDHVRKFAHFAEFFVLGAECAAYFSLRIPSRPVRLLSLALFGIAAPLCDETIQIFSSRGPMIADVWLDVAGFAAASLIVLFWASGIRRRRNKKEDRKQ